jgi:hypothetical protein
MGRGESVIKLLFEVGHLTIYEHAVTHYPHAVLISVDDYHILPYLYAADTLISKASSTMFDLLRSTKSVSFLYCRARPCSITVVRRCSTKGERLRDGSTCGGHHPGIA